MSKPRKFYMQKHKGYVELLKLLGSKMRGGECEFMLPG